MKSRLTRMGFGSIDDRMLRRHLEQTDRPSGQIRHAETRRVTRRKIDLDCLRSAHTYATAPSERYRYTVARETLNIFAMSLAVTPLSLS